MSVATCEVCGQTFCDDLASDRRIHKRRHDRAVAAQTVLRGVGPCKLPINYLAREKLKGMYHDDATRHFLYTMWSHYARSLDSMDFNLRKHPDWQQYARAYLAHERHDAVVVSCLASEFGGVRADDKLPNGASYWGEK